MKDLAGSFLTGDSLSRFTQAHRRIVSVGIGAATMLVCAVAFAAIISRDFKTASSTQVTTTTLTVNRPSGAERDLMLATVAIHGGSSAVVTSEPANWHLIASTTNDVNLTLLTYYKIAGASEPSSYQWVINNQTYAEGAITDYSGVDTSVLVDAFQGNTGLSGTATTSVTPTA